MKEIILTNIYILIGCIIISFILFGFVYILICFIAWDFTFPEPSLIRLAFVMGVILYFLFNILSNNKKDYE